METTEHCHPFRVCFWCTDRCLESDTSWVCTLDDGASILVCDPCLDNVTAVVGWATNIERARFSQTLIKQSTENEQ
jgi:hypothetical protein